MQIVGFKQLRSNRWVALRSNHWVSAYGGWGPCVLIGIPCNYYLLTKFIVSYGGLHAPRRAGLHADGDRHVLSGDRRGLRRRALHRLDSIVCCLLSLDGGCVVEEGGLYWQVAGEGSVAALSTALCDIMPPKFKSRCASKSRQAFQSLRWRQHHGVCVPRCREDVLIRVLSSPGCFVCVLCFARFNALASGADGESCYALPLEVRERVWPEPRPSPRSTPSLIIAWSFVWWNKVGYTIRSARASAWAPGRQSRRAPAGCWLRALRTS
jgi:hypothetical protein